MYAYNPMEFIANENDPGRLAALRATDIIMVAGSGDPQVGWSRDMAATLWGKGIWNAYREWDGWIHDWPYWQRVVPMYIGGHD